MTIKLKRIYKSNNLIIFIFIISLNFSSFNLGFVDIIEYIYKFIYFSKGLGNSP